MVKINCKQNDSGVWCKDKRIKRSCWGFGARCCIEYDNNKKCLYKESYKKGPTPKRMTQKNREQ